MPCEGKRYESLSKLKATSPKRKMAVTFKSPVGDISAVTLIRTDTTLDHNKKAKKVCSAAVEATKALNKQTHKRLQSLGWEL